MPAELSMIQADVSKPKPGGTGMSTRATVPSTDWLAIRVDTSPDSSVKPAQTEAKSAGVAQPSTMHRTSSRPSSASGREVGDIGAPSTMGASQVHALAGPGSGGAG